MKIKIRHGVFETNSSSIHSLAVYKKDDWEKFKKGELYMNDDYYLGNFLTKDEVEKIIDEDRDESYINYEEICDRYEVLTEEVKDSPYIAVSIEGFE